METCITCHHSQNAIHKSVIFHFIDNYTYPGQQISFQNSTKRISVKKHFIFILAEGGRTFIIRHYSGLCAAVRPDQQLHLTSECKDKFRLTPTKSILHISSGRCITTDGNFLKLGNTCTDMFEQTASFSLKHVTSGKCLHPSGGSIQPAVNRFIVFADGCDQDRLQFKFDDFQYGKYYPEGLPLRKTAGMCLPKGYFKGLLWKKCSSRPRWKAHSSRCFIYQVDPLGVSCLAFF